MTGETVRGAVPFVVSAWIVLCGLYGIVGSRNLVHLVICVAVVQSASYVLLMGIGYRTQGVAPIFHDLPLGTTVVDPVVQALMLTDVVVEATVMALLLALAVRAHATTGTLDPDSFHPLRG